MLNTPAPYENEHIMGYILRLTQSNFYDSISWITALTNIYSDNLGNSIPSITFGRIDISRLSKITGTPINILNSMYHKSEGDMKDYKCNFYGFFISQFLIKPQSPKLCPKCLSEDAYIRKHWDLAAYTACSKHKVNLISYCPNCRKKISWFRRNVCECSCGFAFRESNLSYLDEVEIKFSRHIENLIFNKPTKTDYPLSSLDLHHFLCCIYFIAGQFVNKGDTTGKYLSSLAPEKLHPLLIKSYDVFEYFPKNFYKFLDWKKSQTNNIKLQTGILKSFGSLHLQLYKSMIDSTYDFIREAFECYLSEQWDGGYLSNKCSRIQSIQPQSKMYASKTFASDFLNVKTESIDELVRQGKLKGKVQSMGKNRLFRINMSSLQELKQQFNSLLSSIEVGERLGIDRHVVAELAKSKCLEAYRGPNIDYYSRWQFTEESINNLINSIRNQITNMNNQASLLSFHEAVTKLSIIGYDTSKFVLEILSDNLHPVYENNNPGLTRFVFSDKELSDFIKKYMIAIRRGYYTATEVAKLLQVKDEALLKWINQGLLTNANLVSNCWMIPYESVERFKNDYILSAPLARELRTSPRYLVQKLIEQGIIPISGPSIDGGRQYIFKRIDLQGDSYEKAINVIKKKRCS